MSKIKRNRWPRGDGGGQSPISYFVHTFNLMMFLQFPFRGEGGSDKNGQWFPFVLDIELCTLSLSWLVDHRLPWLPVKTHKWHITETCTLINKSLNGYGGSPSNGFRWKVCIEWKVFCLKFYFLGNSELFCGWTFAAHFIMTFFLYESVFGTSKDRVPCSKRQLVVTIFSVRLQLIFIWVTGRLMGCDL